MMIRDLLSIKNSNPKLLIARVLCALAAVLVVSSGFALLDVLNVDNKTGSDVPTPTAATYSQAQEGVDETRIGADVLYAYTVAPDMPKILTIDKINVNARVLPMGVNPDNTVQAPVNIFDSGWYQDGVKPGEIGAVFINAHASGATRMGLFAYLDTLKKGDGIKLEKGDGTTLKYRVLHVESVDLDKVDMRKVLLPYGNTLKGLNLMTCSGKWVQDEQTYDQRTIVYTEQVN